MHSKNLIVLLDDDRKVGAFLSVEKGVVNALIVERSVTKGVDSFLEFLETENPKMRVAESDLKTGDSWVGLEEVSPEKTEYMAALRDELLGRGFVATIVPASLKNVLLSVNKGSLTLEERELFWSEVASISEEEAQVWAELKGNKDDWDRATQD